jgi:hypothetical protein
MGKDNRLIEQDAPEKNTDRAFVKVGKDGAPERPAEKEEKPEDRPAAERPGLQERPAS